MLEIEDFCSYLQTKALDFVLGGIQVFSNFGPGLRALVRLKDPLLQHCYFHQKHWTLAKTKVIIHIMNI